jgi:hypothetical protein
MRVHTQRPALRGLAMDLMVGRKIVTRHFYY